MKKYDSIIIMGGGLTPRGELPAWVKSRFDVALKIRPRPKYYMSTSAGTVYKPRPLDKNGFPIYEAAAGAHYLAQHGVKPENILVEKYSTDTIGNAYFARTLFTDPLKLKKLLIVTNSFHLARTRAIFKWIFNLTPLGFKYELDFLNAPDSGITQPALKQRLTKEQNGLKDVLKKRKQFKNMNALAVWLFSQHAAYAHGKKIKKINPLLLKGY